MWDGVPLVVDDMPTARVLPFASRRMVGTMLGRALAHRQGNSVVLGLGPGGLAVARGIASELSTQLDLWLVRKVRSPVCPALVIGVVAEVASVKLDKHAIAASDLRPPQVRALVYDTMEELSLEAERRRAKRPLPEVAGKTTILVHDGITSTALIAAAIDGVRSRGASHVVVAAPVATESCVLQLASEADEVVVFATPSRLRRIAAWYHEPGVGS
jgi:putative phosphoribosyl transferase